MVDNTTDIEAPISRRSEVSCSFINCTTAGRRSGMRLSQDWENSRMAIIMLTAEVFDT
jgi:hypothetical protein